MFMKENLILRISTTEVLKKHVSQVHNFIHPFIGLQEKYVLNSKRYRQMTNRLVKQ